MYVMQVMYYEFLMYEYYSVDLQELGRCPSGRASTSSNHQVIATITTAIFSILAVLQCTSTLLH